MYLVYSGLMFFLATALLLAAMVAPRRVAGVMALLAIPLAALGGTLSGTLLLAFAYALWVSRRRTLIFPAVMLALIAVALEVPYHLAPRALPTPSRVYVIGDSLASGGFGEKAAWPEVLEKKIRVPVINLAMASGDTATALQRQIPELPAPLDERELVLIEIGGNDMLDGVDRAVFSRQLDQLLQHAGRGGRRVVMFELPLLPGRWSYGATQRRLAGRHRCTLIPKRILARVLLTPGNTLDGIHLTQQGHDALASELAGRFRAAGSNRS
ncbi:MAG TPA: GDSL-type esterase/lipase family protein [Thermoanaerobaculia bacterium]|nr:GDSL-type esterase/lipase family protein [Thermoanaerobaculia bacterium]